MKMAEGVEWALHCCLDLAWAGDTPVPAARLAAHHGLPPAYLTKQLQALGRAGIVRSTPGPRGGYLLDRPPHAVTLMDVVTAVEGPDPAFRCTEIRPDGPHTTRCAIDTAMHRAELARRRELAARTLADLDADVRRADPDAPDHTRARLT
ncbi:RrF2 family transcriptional regulator [Saccharothrix deserti]|uniref:RrF2 family transcriptional regulator n=1 Tax=Saccharothrix deserti TaxID=2593674 RepID=UPI00192E7593|nr:Rrf2 family transcriptional regulator [Saccharothrix deserti]